MVNIPATIRHLVWDKYVSDIFKVGKCYCCKRENISVELFHCGHVVSRKDGGPTTVKNLRPICSLCNNSMGTQNMYKFMKNHEFSINDIDADDNDDNNDINDNDNDINDYINYIDDNDDNNDIPDNDGDDDIGNNIIDQYQSIKIINKSKYKCKACNYETDFLGNWQRHLKSKLHLKKSNPEKFEKIFKDKINFICRHCNKKFSRAYTLERHRDVCKERITKNDNNVIKELKELKEENNKLKMKLELEKMSKKIEVLETEKKFYESEKKLHREIIDSKEKENHFKNQIIVSAGNMVQTSSSTINILTKLFNNAPLLETKEKKKIVLLKMLFIFIRKMNLSIF